MRFLALIALVVFALILAFGEGKRVSSFRAKIEEAASSICKYARVSLFGDDGVVDRISPGPSISLARDPRPKEVSLGIQEPGPKTDAEPGFPRKYGEAISVYEGIITDVDEILRERK